MQSVPLLSALSLLIPLHPQGSDLNYGNRAFNVLRGELCLSANEVIEGSDNSHIFPDLPVCAQHLVNRSMLPERENSHLATRLTGTVSMLHLFAADEYLRNFSHVSLVGKGDADIGRVDAGSCRADVVHEMRENKFQVRFQPGNVRSKVASIAHPSWNELFDIERVIRLKQQTSRRPNVIFGDMDFTGGPRHLPIQGSDLGIGGDINSAGQVEHEDSGGSHGKFRSNSEPAQGQNP